MSEWGWVLVWFVAFPAAGMIVRWAVGVDRFDEWNLQHEDKVWWIGGGFLAAVVMCKLGLL